MGGKKVLARLVPVKITDKRGRMFIVWKRPFKPIPPPPDLLRNLLNVVHSDTLLDPNEFKEKLKNDKEFNQKFLKALNLQPFSFSATDTITGDPVTLEFKNITDFVNIKLHPTKPLMLIKYSHKFMLNSVKFKEQKKIVWNDHMREMRGIVIDYKNNKIVSLPFPKFFNIAKSKETAEDDSAYIKNLPQNEKVYATEKKDGALIVMSHYDGDVLLTSSGSFEEGQSAVLKRARELYEKLPEKTKQVIKNLTQSGYTLMFEVIAPESKVVIDYDEEKLYLTGIRRNNTGQLFTHDDLLQFKEYFNLPEFRVFKNIKSAVKFAETTKKNIEGYVLKFKSTGQLIKLKTEEYFKKYQSQRQLGMPRLYENYLKNIPVQLKHEEFLGLVKKAYKFFKYFDNFMLNTAKESIEKKDPKSLQKLPITQEELNSLYRRLNKLDSNNEEAINKILKTTKKNIIKRTFAKVGIGNELEYLENPHKIFAEKLESR